MSSLVFRLPYPPSVNSVWIPIAKGKNVLSDPVRKYREAAAAQVMVQQVPRWDRGIRGRLSCMIQVTPPMKQRRRDLDNLMKATLDALQHAGVIEDDEHIDSLIIFRGPPAGLGELRVTIATLEEDIHERKIRQATARA